MPLISVVMPVYNGEKHLGEAIDSILVQTITDWELLAVIEYGSSAKSMEILRDYAERDARIKLIYNKERLGIAASLNLGLDAATGEFIARMDADDISSEERFEKQVTFLREHADIDICGIQPQLFGDGEWEWRIETDPDIIKAELLFYTPFVHPTIMARREKLNQFGLRYNPDYKYTEDYEFFSRCGKNLRFSNIKDKSLFFYRISRNNATSIGGQQGVTLYRSITGCLCRECVPDLTEQEIDLLCIHTYPNASSAENALEQVCQLDLLLKRIFTSKKALDKYGIEPLFVALHHRWNELSNRYQFFGDEAKREELKAAIARGLFAHEHWYSFDNSISINDSPMVSILIPTYNCEKYIQDTVYSLLVQDFSDFELLIINEPATQDKTIELIQMFQDPRIRIITNERRLGLAESLNKGIRMAKGKYIARADADDVYPPNRLSRQVLFLESHPDISMCGSWQRHFGNRNYIHKAIPSVEGFKAQILFNCDMCHSTVMLRKEDFVSHDLFYDKNYLAEDFELWSRAVHQLRITNIPEVLGEYRWNGDNITIEKKNRIEDEAERITARSLKKLNINIKENDLVLLCSWENIVGDTNRPDHKSLLKRELKLLKRIQRKNHQMHIYDEEALKDVLNRRKNWVLGYGSSINLGNEDRNPLQEKRTLMKERIKRLLSPAKRIVLYIQKPLRKELHKANDALWRLETKNDNIIKLLEESTNTIVEQEKESIDTVVEQVKESIDTVVEQEKESKDAVVHQLEERVGNAIRQLEMSTDGRIWKAELSITHMMQDLRYEVLSSAPRVVLVGTSSHNNIGDAAITCGEYELLKKIFPGKGIYELAEYEYEKYCTEIDSFLRPGDILFLQGGGNLGNRYIEHEIIRRDIITRFHDHPVVVFPQTIFFSDDEKGRQELELSAEVYNAHPNLTLFTRGEESLAFAQRFFPNVRSVCMPDTALLLFRNMGFTRSGVLLCLRDLDDESGLTKEQYNEVLKCVKKMDSNYKFTNNLSEGDIPRRKRAYIVNEQLRLFASAEVVVTDRLHGMIFAIMTSTPCVVISSYNRKLNEFAAMFADSNAVVFIEKNLEQLEIAAQKMIAVKEPVYPLLEKEPFEKMIHLIKDIGGYDN